VGAEDTGQAQPDGPGLAVDDDARRSGGGKETGRGVGVGQMAAAALPGRAAVGDDDEQRTALRIANPLHPQHLVRP
jgi:hypothetical protein